MLNGEAASPPQSPLPPPPQDKQDFPPPTTPLRTRMLSAHRSRLRFIYSGAAVALLCALAAFYFLFRWDRSPVPKARVTAASPVAAPAPTQTSTASVAAPVISPPKEAPKQQEPPRESLPEPVQFRVKRSKAFEKVGPIRLRLVKANPKWNTCDLYISSGGPSYQKQLHLNKPVQIDLRDGVGSAELVVTSIRADQISGSVQQKQ